MPSTARIALAAGVLAVVLIVSAGPGTRFGLWGYRFGLTLVLGTAGAAFVALVAGVASIISGGSRGAAVAALLLAIGAAAGPLGVVLKARGVPMIHDISTDTDDPPLFVAVLSRRAAEDNPAAYGGPEVAAAQHRAYPDLRSVDLGDPPGRVFERAQDAVRRLGWELVASDRAAGRIEATDTTFWFGFKDDVAIRVRPQGSGSRVDVRSVSRVGKSDLGANAARIRRLLTALQG
jgi:Protein of unknown function (DUF1499)